MKYLLIFFSVTVGCLGIAAYVMKHYTNPPCWCWSRGQGMIVTSVPHLVSSQYTSFGSYGTETDWNDPQRIIPLNYSETEGKLVFYQQCVWCHADATPAGPSNRSNVTPTPPLMNDGTMFNGMSDAYLQQIIAAGGRAMGKSAMMPPYGKSLTPSEIRNVVAYMRAIAAPAYRRSSGRIPKNRGD